MIKKNIIFLLLSIFLITMELKPNPTEGFWDFGNYSRTVFQYKVSSTLEQIYHPKNLFDSNQLTLWASQDEEEEEWILVDFGEKRLMNQLVIEFPSWFVKENQNSNSFSYFIQVNIWGEWTTIEKSNHISTTNFHRLRPMDASMIRVYFKKFHKLSIFVSNLKLYLEGSLINGLEPRFTGYKFPIQYGVLPNSENALPGAPRNYRSGYHKGLDIYEYEIISSGYIRKLSQQTKVLSIESGRIIRIDHDYVPMSPQEYENQKELTRKLPVTFVDRDFGGRQIWIDHGNGIVSSYNHLSSISDHLTLGLRVKKGEVIGTAGNSGLYQESYGFKEENIHLHLEIWIDGEYLGNGLTPEQSKELLRIFFSPNKKENLNLFYKIWSCIFSNDFNYKSSP